MKSSTMKRGGVSLAAMSLVLGVAACGAGNENSSSTGGSGESTGSSAAGSIKGAGASSMEKAQGEWMATFTDTNPDATVEYSPDGSGTGREKFINGAVNFAGSDSAMDDEEMAQAKDKGCTGDTIQFPVYVSPIAVAYNLEGVDELNLSPEVMADIFNRKITQWDDAKIKADNPDAQLPSTRITTVNRSDDSGTTENFQNYLAAAAPKSWPHEPGDAWPVKGGEAAKGTSGVVDAIGAGEGTIGYADASQIGDLGAAKVKAGDEFIEYSPEAAAKVLETAKRTDEGSTTNFAVELDQANAGDGVYPVVLVSYAIACTDYADVEAAKTTKAYLEYISSQEGQDAATEAAGNAPLSEAAQENAKSALSNIKVD